MSGRKYFDVEEVKAAADGRAVELLTTLGGIPAEILDGKHHPCPLCSGDDRFRLLDAAAGAVYCNQCFDGQNGDFIAALQWSCGWSFQEALKQAADHLGVKPAKPKKLTLFPSEDAVKAALVKQYASKEFPDQVPEVVRVDRYDTFAVLRVNLPTEPGRKQRKTFRPVHHVRLPDGQEGYILGYPDGPRPLFRRKELAEGPKDLVVVCGGEKATEAAVGLGLVATTCAGGEKAVKKTDWSPLVEFEQVVVSIDNDAAGVKYGELVAAAVKVLKPELPVKILELPDLPKAGDIVEWIEAGGTREAFLELVEKASASTLTHGEIEALADKKRSQSDGGDKKEDDPGLVYTLAKTMYIDNHFAKDSGGRLYRYVDGTYKNGEDYVKARVKRLCILLDRTSEWSSRLAKEVVEYIRVDAPKLWECPPLDLLSVKNGLLRIKDRNLLPHSPGHLTTVQLPIEYDPDATCPNIEKFIGQVFPSDAHDLAWEVPAWLMRPDKSIQKAVLLTGDGANGKSTWLQLVIAFLGKKNICAVSLHKLEDDRFAPARLVGKLANICPDLPSEHLAGTGVFKAITGGDTLTGEIKFKDSFDFEPFARLVFSANHPPRSADASHAFFRRWLVVPFDRTFSEDERIPQEILMAKLTAREELSGMLNKALGALDRLRSQRGFSEPESVRQAWSDFHATTDPLAVWLDKFTIDDPDAHVVMRLLRAAYNAAAEQSGRPTMGEKAFGTALRRLRPDIRDRQKTVNAKRVWVYVGIGLLGEENDPARSARDARDNLYSVTNRARKLPVEAEGDDEGTVGEKQSKDDRVHRVHCVHRDTADSPTYEEGEI